MLAVDEHWLGENSVLLATKFEPFRRGVTALHVVEITGSKSHSDPPFP